jgi:hypothetical protein
MCYFLVARAVCYIIPLSPGEKSYGAPNKYSLYASLFHFQFPTPNQLKATQEIPLIKTKVKIMVIIIKYLMNLYNQSVMKKLSECQNVTGRSIDDIIQRRVIS